MSSSDFRLKLVFRQTVGGGLYSQGESNGVPNVNASDENHEHFSIMQNLDDYTYEFTYGSSTFNAYHFVMISYDKVTNNGIDSYIQKKRQEWIQNTNPNTTSANPGYTHSYLQPDYTSYSWNGLAISSQSSNTILDGSPDDNSSWWYSIGTITLHNGGIPSIDGHVADRVELYMFYNPNEMKNDFSSSTLSVSGTLDIGGEFFSQDLIGEIKMFPPTVNHFSLFESFLPCDGRTIKSIHLKGQYQKLIDYLKGSTGHSSVQIPNYNSNHYLICDLSKTYNDSFNNGSRIDVNHIPSHNHSVTTGVGYNSMNLAYTINNTPSIDVSTNFLHNFQNIALGKNYNHKTTTHNGGTFNAGSGNRHSKRHEHAVQRSSINSIFTSQRKYIETLTINAVPTLDDTNSNIPSNFNIDISGINTQNIQYNDSSITSNVESNVNHLPSSVGMMYYIRYK